MHPLYILLLPAILATTTASDPFLIMGHCPHRTCASTITKCQVLQEACICQPPSPALAVASSNPPEPCPCCRRCARCLGDLFAECCGCLDICDHPVRNASHRNNADGPPRSEVMHLKLAISGLFEQLVKHPGSSWTTFSYPDGAGAADASALLPTPVADTDAGIGGRPATVPRRHGQKRLDGDAVCTVAYVVQCMSWRHCKAHCTEMGAIGMRWFHDSCCECVGDSCRDRGGLDESRCQNCSVAGRADGSGEAEVEAGGMAGIYTHLPHSVMGLVPASLPAAFDYDDVGVGEDGEDYAVTGSDGDEEDEDYEEFQSILYNEDDSADELILGGVDKGMKAPDVAVSSIPEATNNQDNNVIAIGVTDYYDDEDEMTDKTEMTVI